MWCSTGPTPLQVICSTRSLGGAPDSFGRDLSERDQRGNDQGWLGPPRAQQETDPPSRVYAVASGTTGTNSP
jgi:hypothetical protein